MPDACENRAVREKGKFGSFGDMSRRDRTGCLLTRTLALFVGRRERREKAAHTVVPTRKEAQLSQPRRPLEAMNGPA